MLIFELTFVKSHVVRSKFGVLGNFIVENQRGARLFVIRFYHKRVLMDDFTTNVLMDFFDVITIVVNDDFHVKMAPMSSGYPI